MNAIATSKQHALARAAEFADILESVGSDIQVFDGLPLLRFKEVKGGADWFFGQDDKVLDPNDLVAFDPYGIQHGYIAFSETQGIQERLYPLTQQRPSIDSLPDLGTEMVKGKGGKMVSVQIEWQLQISMPAKIAEGPNAGEEMVYKPTSGGGLKFAKKLIANIVAQMRSTPLEAVPVLELLVSSYHSKKFNREIFEPDMELVRWIGVDGPAPLADEPEEAPVQHPKRGERAVSGAPVEARSRRAPAPEPVIDDGGDEVFEDDLDKEVFEDEDVQAPPAPRRGRPARNAEPVSAPRQRNGRGAHRLRGH